MFQNKSLLARFWRLLPVFFVCNISQASLSTSVYGQIYTGAPPPLVFCSQAGTSSAACSGGTALNLQATADYGNLSAVALVTGGPRINVLAGSTFTDILTVGSTGVPSGFVDYHFRVVGQARSSDEGLSLGVTQNGLLTLSYLPYYSGFHYGADGLPVAVTVTTSVAPFTSGIPFSLVVSAAVDTYAGAGSYNDQIQVTLTGISLFDASLQPLADGATVNSDSSNYGGLVTDRGVAAETPEPSMSFLLPLALASLIWVHRRYGIKQRSQHPEL